MQTPIDDLVEGSVVVGTITDIWLYHGAEIDIGAQFDGCVLQPYKVAFSGTLPAACCCIHREAV